jgi:hypothetical protein
MSRIYKRLYDDADARSADIAQLQQSRLGIAPGNDFLPSDPRSACATSGRARATLLDEDYTILSTDQHLNDFIKSKGGLNECARRFARSREVDL